MKQKILDNVSEYSTEQLVRFIREGVVSFEELISDTDGEFAPAKKREVKELLDHGEDIEWEKAREAQTTEGLNEYLEIYPDGNYVAEARKLLEKYKLEEDKSETQNFIENEWGKVQKNNIQSLELFINNYKSSTQAIEASRLINDLMLREVMYVNASSLATDIRNIQTQKGKSIDGVLHDQKYIDDYIIAKVQEYLGQDILSKDDFKNMLSDDSNLLSAGVVKRLIDEGVISINDLRDITDIRFIQKMYNNESAVEFPKSERLDRIHKQSTEVYFWGIPSSGKTCALGAILSVAANGSIAQSMDLDIESQGYGYMARLINLFKNGDIGTLVGGTAIDSFYEMGFDLIDYDGKIHPITCIDMAGELMRCMYKSNAKEEMDDRELEMLDTLSNVLIDNRSTNRKMHFFVIEYGAEDRLYEGLPQKAYLEAALSYIKNTGIFEKETDAIYLMISKADKAKEQTAVAFKKYLDDNYRGFYNGLEQICLVNEINKGKVDKIAFSLGKVSFQNYCVFDSTAAEEVVRTILNRSVNVSKSKFSRFTNFLKR